MKKLGLLLVLISAAIMMVAQTGMSCDDPIPVDSNYVGTVPGAGTYWYTAGTYDLPLHVFFLPVSDTSTVSPKVEVDFTCVPGVYDDPKLDSLINLVEDFDIVVPVKLDCDLVVRDGKNAWDLSINKNYREQMAEFGITYNVQAFIKVTFFEGGDISLKPDTAFQSCMDNAQYLHLGDTIDVLPNDSDRVFVMPYTDWQNDSIRFVWIGEGTSNVYIAQQECDFVPNGFDPYVWDVYSVTQDVPYKLYSEQMKDAIEQCVGGGLLYGKILATSAGKLVVEQIPIAAAEGGATLLEYGQSIELPANDASALYCFPRTWAATQWLTNTRDSVQMFISTTHDFQAVEGDANVLKTLYFDKNDGLTSLFWSSEEMKLFTSVAEGDYLYVRFLSKETSILIPEEWSPSECVDKSTLLRPSTNLYIAAKSSADLIRLRYEDYAGYPLEMKWTGAGAVEFYIGSSCDFALSPDDPVVIFDCYMKRKSSYSVDAATVSSWADHVDADGFLYLRGYSDKAGNISFQTEKPQQPTLPAVLLELNTPITLDVENPIVYCFDANFAKQSVELVVSSLDSVVAHMGTSPEFIMDENDASYLGAYDFVQENGQNTLQLSALQLTNLLEQSATGYVFVIFSSSYPTQITPILWNACACVENSLELLPIDTKYLEANSANIVYRVKYSQWQEHDVKLHWASTETLEAYLADTCEFTLTTNNRHVLNYNDVDIMPNDTMVIGEDVRAEAIDFGMLPADGFLYFRFQTAAAGWLTTSYDKNAGGPTTGVENTIVTKRNQVYCTPEGRLYIVIDNKRYNILGQVVD